MSLAGKTVFITGASRGIGLAIGRIAARDGANVVIAAKTVTENPKLPGTIYTAAAEIEKAGGQALACEVDIRDEGAVERAVQQTVDKFGGIDILINNASAISLTGTLQTPMKRYDLMHSVNTRGTFMTTQKCLPHLLKSKHAHILNISPPLEMKPHWFKNHTAYTMAKYGMSMCVLGHAAELRDAGIAVNALWPQTAIATAAVANHLGGDESIRRCRTPEIMADAAHAILTTTDCAITGQFLIDEEVLLARGCTEADLDKYATVPGTKREDLIPDFFLPEGGANPEWGKDAFSKASRSKL